MKIRPSAKSKNLVQMNPRLLSPIKVLEIIIVSSVLALTPIEISRDTLTCIGNNDGWEFVTVNPREVNARQPSSLENPNFGDQPGSSPSAHFKHDMRVDAIPYEDSNFSEREGGNNPPSNDLVNIPEDILRGSKRKHAMYRSMVTQKSSERQTNT